MPVLRRLETRDHAAVLELNHRNVEALAPLDPPGMHQLERLADRFDVVETDGEFGGFVVTIGPGAAYDSENYRWFAERHDGDFYYLDRIVLVESQRRRGLGTFVYDEIEQVARPFGRLTLEVNLIPRNDVSLRFHDRRGYVEVGRLGDEQHLVSLREKTLR